MIAGDLFDRWDAPAELINHALEQLPQTEIYAVPGQHDLPHHRYDDIRKSAYWTLVAAGRIKNLEPGRPESIGDVGLWGFPWDAPPRPLPRVYGAVNLAVVHRYLWRDGHTYPDAPVEQSVEKTLPLLDGYDAAVFGDNHRGFYVPSGTGTNVYNHGALIRRRADERDLRPTAGLLQSDGSIRVVELDTSADEWAELPEISAAVGGGIDAADLVKLLETAADGAISFRDAAMRCLENDPKLAAGVRALLREWLGTKS